ncbi:MAG: hypothetical protein ACP5OU_02580 [Methanothrix sp.]
MILSLQVEKLSAHLSTLAPLMDRYQKGDPSFADEALKWLEEAAKVMSSLRLPECSEMSALRGRILKAGDLSRTSSVKPSRTAARQARNAASADALEHAEEIMQSRVLAAEKRLRFFDEKICEILATFMAQKQKTDIITIYQVGLDQVWKEMSENPTTRPHVLYVSASISSLDRSVILNQILNRTKENLYLQ